MDIKSLLVISFGVALAGLILSFAAARRMIQLCRGLAEVPLYRPLPDVQFPRASRRFFEERSAALLELGFLPCGDYRPRLEIAHYCRLFVDPTGTIACELAYLQGMLWKRYRVTGFFSLLENLDCAETSDLDIPPLDGQLVTRGIRRASAGELLAAHRELLSALQAERRVAPVELAAEDLPLVAVYLAALMHEYLVANGRRDHNAFAATFPQIRAAVERLVPEPVI